MSYENWYVNDHHLEREQCPCCGTEDTSPVIRHGKTPSGEEVTWEREGWLECPECSLEFPSQDRQEQIQRDKSESGKTEPEKCDELVEIVFMEVDSG